MLPAILFISESENVPTDAGITPAEPAVAADAVVEPAEAVAAWQPPAPIFAAQDYTWRELGQRQCLETSAAALTAALGAFALDLAVFSEAWFVEAAAADPNIAIACIAGGDMDGLVDPVAARVLSVISVYSTDRDLARAIRDFLEDWLNVESSANPGDIGWITSALNLTAEIGTRHTFNCPATQEPQSFGVWGTDIYTDDSSICLAAVHAGLITFACGPVVRELIDGQQSYLGTERNGVASLGYGAWGRSFGLVRPAK